ncbi:MAG: hypothetical protein AAB593_01010 [Patescibacteria group bacterium]
MKLYIQENQGAASIINQLTKVDSNEIKLIFPNETDFFNNSDNLELLMNQARFLKKNISIVTENQDHLSLIQKFGIKTDDSINPIFHSRENNKEQDIEEGNENSYLDEIGKDFNEDEKEIEFTKRYFDLGGIKRTENNKQQTTNKEYEIDNAEKEISQELDREIYKQEIRQELEYENEDEYISQKKSDFRKYNKLKFLLNWRIIIGIIIIIAVIWGYFYLPQAKIKVFSVKEKISFSSVIEARADISDIDIELRQMSAQIIESVKTAERQVKASDAKYVEKKAESVITVYNDLSTPQKMIPSRFQANNGNIYWSVRNIEIPAKGNLEIKVIAAVSGKKYKLDCSKTSPCEFKIPAWKGTANYDKIYAKGYANISGGFIGNSFDLTDKDSESVRSEISKELLNTARIDINSQVLVGFELIDESLQSELSDLEFIDKKNDNGEYTVKGKLKLKAFIIKKEDLKNLIDGLTKSQINENKTALKSTVDFDYTIDTIDYDNNFIKLNINATQDVGWKIDIDNLIQSLAGKKESDARKVISNTENINSVDVALWPFWVRHIPLDIKRIEILLDSY